MWLYPKAKINFKEFPDPRENPFVRLRGDSCPIHKLPIELLARTFEFASAYNDRKYDELITSSKYRFLEEAAEMKDWQPPSESMSSDSCPTKGLPVVVSHVCRHWRNVAISTPSIWADIRISPDTMDPPYELVSLHLERSKNLPIDIHITTVGGESDETETASFANNNVKLLYSLLIPHVFRWRFVEITALESTHTDSFLDAVSHPSTSPASQLTSLRLHFNDIKAQTDSARRRFLTFFNGSAPQLRDVLLSGVHVDWNQTWISSASNLTSLQLMLHHEYVRPSWTQFATILCGAPSLKKLALYFSEPADPPEDWVIESTSTNATVYSDAPIQLLQLTDLILGSLLEDVAIAFLRKFYMPALTGLILDSAGSDYTALIEELVWPDTSLTLPSAEDQRCNLLGRLERLAIINLPCEEDLIVAMFEELSNLKSLRIATEGFDASFFFLKLLLQVNLLRKLENLFACPGRGDFPTIRRIVQRRIDAGIPLKALYLPWGEVSDMGEEEEAWFRDRLERLSPVNRVYRWNTDHAFETEWVG